MIPVPSGVRGVAGDRPHRHEKGLSRPCAGGPGAVERDLHRGHLFIFRGRRGALIKVLWHDGQGACLFSKKLERGRFIWPSPADGVITFTPAQLGYLLEGIDLAHAAEDLAANGDMLTILALHVVVDVIASPGVRC